MDEQTRLFISTAMQLDDPPKSRAFIAARSVPLLRRRVPVTRLHESSVASETMERFHRVDNTAQQNSGVTVRRQRFQRLAPRVLWILLGLSWLLGTPPSSAADSGADQIMAVEAAGKVEWLAAGTGAWRPLRVPRPLQPGDRIRTGENSRATLRFGESTVIPLGPRGLCEIQPPPRQDRGMIFRILRGVMYLFHRGEPLDIEVQSGSSSAAIRGTEFVFQVTDTGRDIISMIDGEVELRHAGTTMRLTDGEQAVAEPGAPPIKSPLIDAVGPIQWRLYYPGVLNPDDLELDDHQKAALLDSLAAYRQGDLLRALARYPTERVPATPDEKLYRSAVLLAVGQVEEAENHLVPLQSREPGTAAGRIERLARALLTVIASVKGESAVLSNTLAPADSSDAMATEWLADSYRRQSLSDLPGALRSAREAVARSPGFGFGWARVAELEFSFGRREHARTALEKALSLSPRNAQAVTVRGFIFSAANRQDEALAAFDRAIDLDGALGNAWLGRGLSRIRKGEFADGRRDLQVAAALEPTRAVLRSYLGKAYQQEGSPQFARLELNHARRLDPDDPTAWLYLALLNQQRNRINQAITDLEQSKRINQNRSLYRSRLLLDQDQAVRGANLALMYQDAAMEDVARREALQAVAHDYANYSAHLFLANSYNQLRDPNQVNQRYETAWFSEFLLANLLAPVGANTLSQLVSQQEYSRLFERNRLGVVSRTEYNSNGDWSQSGAQHGRSGLIEYAAEAFYRSRIGQRLNNDLEQYSLTAQVKLQLTPDDSVLIRTSYYEEEKGDLTSVYDPDNPLAYDPDVRDKDIQEPNVLAGYRHTWSPGSHTLLLAAWLNDTLTVDDPIAPFPRLKVASDGVIGFDDTIYLFGTRHYESKLELLSAEGQQIWQTPDHTLVVGSRYQAGRIETDNRLGPAPPALTVPYASREKFDIERWTAYGHYSWHALEPLVLEAGIAYDHLTYPVNHRFAPLSDHERTTGQFSPKAGFTYTPVDSMTLRAAYARALGGVSFDQSVRLEPSQVAGFNHAWRSLIPESVAGAQAGADFEVWGVEWDQRFPTRTYLGVKGEWLSSDLEREVGVWWAPFPTTLLPYQLQENLDYRERSLQVTLNQLIGNCWSLGGAYRLSEARLELEHPQLAPGVPPLTDNNTRALLNQVDLFALFQHPTGFLGRFDALWSRQSNHGYSFDLPGDDFWQFNLWGGFRFPGRRAEIRLGIVNLTDQDYRLNPLNLTAELPRDRTFVATLRLNF